MKMTIKVTDKRRTPALTRTQAETDAIFVNMVASLGDVLATAESIVAVMDMEA